jgi:cell shape-determining protein MreC
MEKFTKKIKKYFTPQKNYNEKVINPNKHWAILLSLFSFTLICLIIFSLYLLIRIRNDNFLQTAPVKKVDPNSLNEKLFSKVINYFDEKTQKAEELKSTTEVIHDPSL